MIIFHWIVIISILHLKKSRNCKLFFLILYVINVRKSLNCIKENKDNGLKVVFFNKSSLFET